jgi:multiple sugar transport system substrate-binding protein
MMYYNKRILQSAGVDIVPVTYGEYLAAGEKIARAAASRKGFDVWLGERDIRPIWWQRLFDFYPFYIAASNGRTLFVHDSVAFENDAAVKVFAFFQQCYSLRYYPRTFFQGGDPFLLEKKATNFAGAWEIAHIHKFVPQLQFDIAPLPVPDDHQGPVYMYGDFKNISIFSNTRHPREAWEFVKYLITAENDLLLLALCDQIPVRGDLLTNPLFRKYFGRSPLMVKFAAQAPFTRGVDVAPDLKEILDAISQAYESCAVYGRISPEEAVQNAARRTKAIVEWNQ